jgi:hypothetical protein
MNIKNLSFSLALAMFAMVSQYYTIEAFQSEYVEIEDFESLFYEFDEFIDEEKFFFLPFDFPYFDLVYNQLSLEGQRSLISFPDEIDFSLRLMSFIYEWNVGNIVDPDNVESDIRYKFDSINDKQVLIIQYTKIRLASDGPIFEESDYYLNFQIWLWEDGIIEIKIGPHQLENSPNYVPGEGFYLLTNAGPINLGPRIALHHPLDQNIVLTYQDGEDHTSPTLILGHSDFMRWLPPAGWVIRFTNQTVSTRDMSRQDDVTIYPNPAIDYLTVSAETEIKSIEIYNISGQLVLRNNDSNQINISSLPAASYFCHIKTSNGKIIKKLIKK